MGPLTNEVEIAVCSLIIVAVCLHYHIKGAFCAGLLVGTLLWWFISGEYPAAIAESPKANLNSGDANNKAVILLIFNLFFLFVLTLNGLARSLSDLAQLTKKTGAIPRGNFLLIVCGLTTMLSGYMSGPPILISPESAAGIKAGAKTGLSTLVCGILFLIATFFSPIFAAVPAAGTAPLLIMVGVMMFGNAKRIDWTDYKIAVPAYCVLFFIPFTYSILRGVVIGYVIYIMIGLFTGDMIGNTLAFIDFYRQPWRAGHKSRALSESEIELGVDPLDPAAEGEEQEELYVYPADNTTVVGRTFNKINKFLDSMEMQESGVKSF